MAGQFIGQPGQGDAGIAQHIAAHAFFRQHAIAQHPSRMRGQVQCSPIGIGRRSQHKAVGAGIVGNQLGQAGVLEILESRIRQLDRGMQACDMRQHLLLGVGIGTRRQVIAHAEGKFQFRNLHQIARQRAGAAVFDNTLSQQPPGKRAIHPDMTLPRQAGRGDLPAIERQAAEPLDPGLDAIGFRAIGGPQFRRQRVQLCPLRPMPDQQGAGRLHLFLFHGLGLSQSFAGDGALFRHHRPSTIWPEPMMEHSILAGFVSRCTSPEPMMVTFNSSPGATVALPLPMMATTTLRAATFPRLAWPDPRIVTFSVSTLPSAVVEPELATVTVRLCRSTWPRSMSLSPRTITAPFFAPSIIAVAGGSGGCGTSCAMRSCRALTAAAADDDDDDDDDEDDDDDDDVELSAPAAIWLTSPLPRMVWRRCAGRVRRPSLPLPAMKSWTSPCGDKVAVPLPRIETLALPTERPPRSALPDPEITSFRIETLPSPLTAPLPLMYRSRPG